MSDKRLYILNGPGPRQNAIQGVTDAQEGYRVTITPPVKKREQEEKYHAQIGDIARQTTYAGRKWEFEDMKRILIDEFAAELREQDRPLHHDGRLIPSEDGRRVIQLGLQSRQFWVKEASDFITFLDAWGNERGVKWGREARREVIDQETGEVLEVAA